MVTQAGQTYERAAIESHIKVNGNTDPMTREPISQIVYPNIVIKSGVDDFLVRNPWAYEHTQEENWRDIQF